MRPWAMKALMNISLASFFVWLLLGAAFEVKAWPEWYPAYEQRIFVLCLLGAAVGFAVRMEQEEHEFERHEYGKIIGFNNELVVLEVRRAGKKPKTVVVKKREFPIWDFGYLAMGSVVFLDGQTMRAREVCQLAYGEQGRILYVDDVHVYVRPWASRRDALAEVPLEYFRARDHAFLFPGRSVRVQSDGAFIAL